MHKNVTGFIRQANPKKAAVGTAFFDRIKFKIRFAQMFS
jgi:hypothetical protein